MTGLGDAQFQDEVQRLRPFLVKLARMKLARKDEAEDIVQDTLTYLWLNKHKYDPGKGSVGGWFGHALMNRMKNDYRDMGRDILHGGMTHQLPPMRAGQDAWVDVRELMDQTARLPPKMRECLVLYYVRGLSLREIGQEVGISMKNVSKHIRNGLGRLRGWANG